MRADAGKNIKYFVATLSQVLCGRLGSFMKILTESLYRKDHFLHLFIRQGIIKGNAEYPLIKPFRVGA